MSDRREERTQDGRHTGFLLLPTLLLAIGALVLLSVGSVFLLQWTSGRGLIQEFAKRLIARNLHSSELALRNHLDAAVFQANFVADAIVAGRLSIAEPKIEPFLVGSLAAAPQMGVTARAMDTFRGCSTSPVTSNSSPSLKRHDVDKGLIGAIRSIGRGPGKLF
jgi:hypothetical protein